MCAALTAVAAPHEICVRSGGDEFFLIRIGRYSREDEADRTRIFTETLAKLSESSGKPYRISASVGCAVFEDCRQISLDSALREADERMYRNKLSNRRL